MNWSSIISNPQTFHLAALPHVLVMPFVIYPIPVPVRRTPPAYLPPGPPPPGECLDGGALVGSRKAKMGLGKCSPREMGFPKVAVGAAAG